MKLGDSLFGMVLIEVGGFADFGATANREIGDPRNWDWGSKGVLIRKRMWRVLVSVAEER